MMFFLTICCSKADHFLLKCPFNKLISKKHLDSTRFFRA